MKVAHIQKLRKAYREKRLIPFIGAGLSAPFKVPTWGELIEIIASKYVDELLMPSISHYINKQNYWKAIESIKDFGEINELILQKEICSIIKEKVSLNKGICINSHNYSDLAKLSVLNYITTNYDFLLYEFLPTKTTIPQVLHKVDICSQLFFEDRKEPRIWHLHGHLDDYGSIVISKEKYEELYYSNSKYRDLFKLFQGSGVLLFMGFSFNDYYIKDLLKRNNKSYNSEHFIILDNPTPEVKKNFINEFGINVIEYDSENNTKHAECLRNIVNEIRIESHTDEIKSKQNDSVIEDWPENSTKVQDYLFSVKDYCANLPYLSLNDIRSPQTLDKLYVPLKASSKTHKVKEEKSKKPGIVDIVEEINNHQHLFIIGKPGAGKSTLLRQIAQRCWTEPEVIGLDSPHLPLIIPLRQLVDLKGTFEERLSSALSAELSLIHKLPKGFFVNWSKKKEAPWLILFDALDEVPAKRRPRLIQWINSIIKSAKEYRVIITSRPNVTTELENDCLGHYELSPFTTEQIFLFAEKWFGDKANRFINELDQVQVGRLSDTPLLLTIAAKIFLKENKLPERRTTLYNEFVNVWLREAQQQGLETELGERLSDLSRPVLARLALLMTESPNEISGVLLQKEIAFYLNDVLKISIEEAYSKSERLIEVLARRSGFFICRGNTYEFIHPTFREYLTAEAKIHKYRWNFDEIQENVVLRWSEQEWYEIVLLTLGILSEQEINVTRMLATILESNNHQDLQFDSYEDYYEDFPNLDNLIFVSNAVVERVKVNVSFMDYLANKLFELIEYDDYRYLIDLDEFIRNSFKAIIIGGSLSTVERLRSLTLDKNAYGYLRYKAMEILITSKPLEVDIKLLLLWGRGEELLGDDEIGNIHFRADIAYLLGELNYYREAERIYLSLFEDVLGYSGNYEFCFSPLERLFDLSQKISLLEETIVFIAKNYDKIYEDDIFTANTLLKEYFKANKSTNALSVVTSLLTDLVMNNEIDEWACCEIVLIIAEINSINKAKTLLSFLKNNLHDSYATAYVSRKLQQLQKYNHVL